MWRDFGDALQAFTITVDSMRKVGRTVTLLRAGLDLGHVVLIRHVLAENRTKDTQDAEKGLKICHFASQSMIEKKVCHTYVWVIQAVSNTL